MDLLAATITEVQIAEPRLCALHALWQAKRCERPMPARGDFAWPELKPWMGNLALLDVLEDGQDFRYRLWGSEIARHLGYELTGRRMSEVVCWLGPNPRDEYRRICATRQPLAVAVRIPDIRRPVRLDKLGLPLSEAGAQVEQILAALYPAPRQD